MTPTSEACGPHLRANVAAVRRVEWILWIGGGSILSGLAITLAIAEITDWARCSHPTSDFNRQTCGVGEHPTLFGVLGLSVFLMLGMGILASSIFLTRNPRKS